MTVVCIILARTAIPALANMGADNFYRLPKLQA